MKKALITGITGQDGSYLTELLLQQGYEVHGVVRRTSTLERSRLVHLYKDRTIYGKRLFLHYAELDDPTTFRRLLNKLNVHECYHLAGQSHVGLSFEIPESTAEMTAMGTLRILEMIRDLPTPPKFFHASSSEIFGRPASYPQNEDTPMQPVNPYGCAKAFATRMVTVYRESFSLFTCNGIMYNHESPRRGENFVTRKICRGAVSIKMGILNELLLGDTSAQRDWGYAPDYARGMWLTLQHPTPNDFVFSTGQTHSVQEVVEIAFSALGLNWEDHVRHDERLLRPAEPSRLVGNSTKARTLLNWEPSLTFRDIILQIVESEKELLAK